MKIHLRAPLWRRTLRTMGRLIFRWAENNDDERISHNGERWFLRQLLAAHVDSKATRPFVVFDVGANTGLYSMLVLHEARQIGCLVELHAFEPSPVAAADLRQLVGQEVSVKVAMVALANWTGEAPLHAGGSGSGRASLVSRNAPDGLGESEITVKVQRLDDYMKQHQIGRIDLLKLDVEGSELSALQGLGANLSPQMVANIQFEYGGTTRNAHVTLRDLEQIVTSQGYAFAKLFPGDLEVRAYREWMDNYAYANYVALSPGQLPSVGRESSGL